MRGLLPTALWALLLGACGQVRYENRPTDGGREDRAVADEGIEEAGTVDAPDASVSPCPQLDADTVHLYTMSDLRDLAGGGDASLIGAGSLQTGNTPCGGDWYDTAGGSAGFVVPASARLALAEGAVDMLIWLPEDLPAESGLLSRDALNAELPGHLSLFMTQGGQLAARAQHGPVDDPTYRCSAASVPRGEWVHVGINWSADGLELWMNGEPQQATGEVVFLDVSAGCNDGVPHEVSLAGNDNPLVLGASSHHSVEGGAEPLRAGPAGVRFDFLRYSRAPRDFVAWRTPFD